MAEAEIIEAKQTVEAEVQYTQQLVPEIGDGPIEQMDLHIIVEEESQI